MKTNPFRAEYPNFFERIGKTRQETEKRVNEIFDTIFFDPEENFWHEPDGDSGCLVDTGNVDARTEGISYGMMMCVQMDRQDLFDKLWRFALRYMYLTEGKHAGYFAWSVSPDGKKNAYGPAPDGEEYFAASLIMAAGRWKSAEFDYLSSARELLFRCVHQSEMTEGGFPMWDPELYYIRFVPETKWSDPSYHLPHFYELFALYADERDRDFWKKAAEESRKYLFLCADPETGLSPEYAEYDGTPRFFPGKPFAFYSDAYRVSSNIALHHLWCGEDERLSHIVRNLQRFMREHPECMEHACDLKGTLFSEPVMHPVGLMATLAAASVVTGDEEYLRRLWDSAPRKGERRYYDNCLYLFAFLMLSGHYRVYLPKER